VPPSEMRKLKWVFLVIHRMNYSQGHITDTFTETSTSDVVVPVDNEMESALLNKENGLELLKPAWRNIQKEGDQKIPTTLSGNAYRKKKI
jgi:hypothetical protein